MKELSSEDNIDKAVFEDETTKNLISKYADGLGHARPYLFLDYRTCTISLDLSDHLSNLGESMLTEYVNEDYYYKADVLRKFVGYSLCIPEDLYRTKWETYWQNKGEKELQLEQSYREPNEAAEGFIANKANEKNVERQFRTYLLERELKNIRKDDFRKKFGYELSERGKNRVWDAVARDYPHLSKPGRKS